MSESVLVYVADDEADLRAMLSDYLESFDLRVEGFADAPSLRAGIARQRPDIVVLDVNMPVEDGFTALASLRRADPDLPVIMLTAAGARTARLAGLDGGADDYVVKPFELRELLARIRAVLARVQRTADDKRGAASSPPALLRFGACSIDTAGRRLLDPRGREVPLTALEYDLLLTFAQRPDRVLSRDALEGSSKSEAGDRRLDVRITRLRSKLADAGCGKPIRTVRGEGYVFIPSALTD